MRIVSVVAYRVEIPLRNVVEHAQASRERTDNVVCEVRLDAGAVGYGEGVPREYVTGETFASSAAMLRTLDRDLLARPVDTFDQALDLVARTVSTISDDGSIVYNAARSAIELAMLDAFSRAFSRPLLQVVAEATGLRAPVEGPNLSYSLVANKRLLVDRDKLTRLRDTFEYEHIKIKVGFGLDDDLKYIATVREVFGPRAKLRLDANRAWTLAQARETLARAKQLDVHVVEDPLEGDDLDRTGPALRSLREELGVEIVLDELLRTLDDARRAIELDAVDVFNLRVSKCGGLRRTAEIARLARQHDVDCQLGSQVGETAILSAAGRLFACAHGSLRFLEGSNEHRKFSPDQYLSHEDLMYGHGGLGKPLTGLGLGITVRPDRVQRSATEVITLV